MKKSLTISIGMLIALGSLTGCGTKATSAQPMITNTTQNQTQTSNQTDASNAIADVGTNQTASTNNTADSTTPAKTTGNTTGTPASQPAKAPAGTSKTTPNKPLPIPTGLQIQKAVDAIFKDPRVTAVLAKTTPQDKINVQVLNANAQPLNNQWKLEVSINGKNALLAIVNATTFQVESVTTN